VPASETPREPVDPDVDLTDAAARRELHTPGLVPVLGAIAVGGILGAEARYVVGLLVPHRTGAWPWATLLTNVSGCLLIGVLMVLITERFRAHPLTRPLLGVGVLGGYTTFSTYVVDAVTMTGSGHAVAALGYAVVTPVLALVAVAAGVTATRALVRERGAR
jgi:fluoride exporter